MQLQAKIWPLTNHGIHYVQVTPNKLHPPRTLPSITSAAPTSLSSPRAASYVWPNLHDFGWTSSSFSWESSSEKLENHRNAAIPQLSGYRKSSQRADIKYVKSNPDASKKRGSRIWYAYEKTNTWTVWEDTYKKGASEKNRCLWHVKLVCYLSDSRDSLSAPVVGWTSKGRAAARERPIRLANSRQSKTSKIPWAFDDLDGGSNRGGRS